MPRRTTQARTPSALASSSSARRRPHVLVHVLREDVEWHVAAEHDGVVERLQIELRSERRFRLLALAVDLAVADLVPSRLPGPRAIAIDLAGHFLGIRSVDVDEERNPLLARPALGVDAGVDDETARTE